ncbi:MAG: cupin domain-containing protein [Campylobacter sp.]|nr:cupin domain-containing protein [Campylobacter sp.]
MKNIFENLNFNDENEIFDEFFKHKNFRIERILSNGQSSQWYDQDEDEWLCLLNGEAEILYDDESKIALTRGDSLYIKAHKKHKVTYTSKECIWLCVITKSS